MPDESSGGSVNTPRQVLFASLIGTTIEFFDFYIYATAAVLVFPQLFFPASDPASATLASLATFAIAFLARPIGSALFGHFGDRVGRKTTLVAALLTMGLSTVSIGAAADLPVDRRRGAAAARAAAGSARASGSAASGAARCCWRSRTRRPASARGTACSRSSARRSASSSPAAVFLALSAWLTDEQFFAFGWRIPFLASAVLVLRRPLRPADDHRDAGLPRGADSGASASRCRCSRVFREHPRTLVARHAVVARDLRAVLPDDGVRAVVGHDRARLLPPDRSC